MMENQGSPTLLKLVARYFVGSLVFFLVAVKFVKISAFGAQIFLLVVAAYLFLLASFKFIELVDAEDCVQCLYCTPWIILFFWLLLFYSFTVMSSDTYSSEQYLLFFYVKIILLATMCIIFLKMLKYFTGRQFQRILGNICLAVTVTTILLVRAWYYQSIDESMIGLKGDRLLNSRSSCQVQAVQKPWMTLLPSIISSRDISESLECGEEKRSFCHVFLGMVTIDGGCMSDERIIVLNDDHMSHLNDVTSVSLCKNMSRLLSVNSKKVSVNYTAPVYHGNDLRSVNCYCEDEEVLLTILPPRRLPVTQSTLHHTPNILVLLINSLSRNQFHDHLPKTVDMLELLIQKGFSVFQFFRYHAVGKTFLENFIPLMSGKAADKLPVANDKDGSIFPWTVYRKRGFETSWVSNECSDNFMSKFHEPYNLDQEIVLPFCHRNFREYNKPENFDGPFPLRKRCVGSRNAHDYVFDYVRKLWTRDPMQGKYTMAHLYGGQDGGSEMLVQLDKSMSTFLKSFVSFLSKSITFIVSDTGNYQGVMADSAYGNLDRKLPAFFIIMHNNLLVENPSLHRALMLNEQQLVTPYDVHRTLHHIASYPMSPTHKHMETSFGVSLLENVPMDRLCSEAGIPPSECTCV